MSWNLIQRLHLKLQKQPKKYTKKIVGLTQIARRVQCISHLTRDLLGLQLWNNVYPNREAMTLFLSTQHSVHIMITLSSPFSIMIPFFKQFISITLQKMKVLSICCQVATIGLTASSLPPFIDQTLFSITFLICRLGGDHP